MDVKLDELNNELDSNDLGNLLQCLNTLGISNITPGNAQWYADALRRDVNAKREVRLR